jgi:hypothetical protein
VCHPVLEKPLLCGFGLVFGLLFSITFDFLLGRFGRLA